MAQIILSAAQINRLADAVDGTGPEQRVQVSETNLVTSRASEAAGVDVPVIAVQYLDSDADMVVLVDGIGNTQDMG